MNRAAALHNVQFSCPELSCFVKNIYQCEAELFVANSKEVVFSREGVTQGGPEFMAFYAAGTTILSECRSGQEVKKIFYADDGAGGSTLENLSEWWKDLQLQGPLIGYFPNTSKTWLIVKPEHLDRAKLLFPDIEQHSNITVEGHGYLGSFIGTPDATKDFIGEKVSEWKKDVESLAKIAKLEPQLAYNAFVFAVSRRWQFVSRTTPHVSEHLSDLEQCIRERFLPAILGERSISDEQRVIFSLPAKAGGLAIHAPMNDADEEYANSLLITRQLREAIYFQKSKFDVDEEAQLQIKKLIRTQKAARYSTIKESLRDEISATDYMMLELASEKGASMWLTSLPVKELGFRLNKQQFTDALCLRYNLPLHDVPKLCACGAPYSISHCLTCKNGGYVHLRHNSVRDTAHELLSQVCKDVRLEPALLPVRGEQLPAGSNCQDGARADVSALGLWIPLNRAFLDIRVLTHSPSQI